MFVITFSEAVKLKSYIWEHFKTNLHIHDTCGGGLYFSLEEENPSVIEFVIAYFKARGLNTEVSSDGLSVFIADGPPAPKINLSFVYEKERCRTAAYDGNLCVGQCDYVEKDGCWIITRTIVKETYRNQKIAKNLVLLLLEEAKKVDITIIPECSYAKKILT